MAESSKEVARPGFETVLDRLEAEAGLSKTERGSLEEWIKGKLTAIIQADSIAEINALATDSGLTASKNAVGRTFEIKDFVLQESADAFRDNSVFKKFVIIQAVDTATGEELLIDGGGDTFVAQLISMRDHFGFPFRGTILAKQTGSGNEFLYWRMAA